MKKLLFISFISIFISSFTFSQKGAFFVGVGPSAGFPVSNNNFSYYYKNGFGGSLQTNFGVSKLGSVTINVLYISIGAKNPPVHKTSLRLIKIGYRTGFLNSRFFVSADEGLARYGSGTNFIVFGGTAGYSFKISKEACIDLFPSYNQIIGTGFNRMWLTANVLYCVNLKKKNK